MPKDKSKTKAETVAPEVEETAAPKVKKDKSAKAEKPAKAPKPVEEDEFADPAGTSDVKITDYEDQLLLITPLSIEPEMTTEYGKIEPLKCNFAVLTDDDGDALTGDNIEEHTNVLVFQQYLRNPLSDAAVLGKRRVLGRVSKGTAKPGKSAPWILVAAEDDDKVIARKYLATIDPFAS